MLTKYLKMSLFVGFSAILLVDGKSAAEEAYQLNAGDVLGISVWNEESLQREVKVLPDGTISFPLVGILDVTGKTPQQVQDQLIKRLSRLIPDPEVNLEVRAVDGNNIFVIGKVINPGRYLMTSPTDVVQALSLAGGFTPYADAEEIKIFRRSGNKLTVIKFNYTRVENGTALETNILLQSGDTIVVP